MITNTDEIQCKNDRRGIISNNKINFISGSIGLYMQGNNGWVNTDTTFIYNNFIPSAGQYGVYLYSCDNTEIYYNNILGTQSDSTSWAFLSYNSGYTRLSNKIFNNNFTNTGGGYAIGYDTTTIDSSGHNGLYSSGPYAITNYTTWPGGNTSLKAFQTSTGLEDSSIIVILTFIPILICT